MRRLILERAWSPQAIHELGIGFDGERITVPIHDADGGLQGLLRYDPFGELRSKMLAVRGTHLGLIPHPTHDLREHLVLAEGPPDMIAARSSGVAAIAVPGAAAWRTEWAEAFTGRQVTVVMDCDAPGREAATRIARDLTGVARSVDVVDLDAERDDGYDLTDRIREHRRPSRHRTGPRPIAWPLAVLLETVSTTRTPLSQEAHT
ncbi:toprim domain-containing protein [Conexibacter sp. DBS9H8]|uniref:toprim domain-containing protein n=1 Tax=Conexibacter sp. DBS9H8 TaxID=2937801 RepID=UPI00200F6281|nr:toprim domain-containing protein [Conexibacter sp. DBS9H8]